MCQLVAHRM
uniref:Uncharacterized protein n=1 Tax=Arundo donax TaxID=35708 RepID=A0A0A9F690_ARUDO